MPAQINLMTTVKVCQDEVNCPDNFIQPMKKVY